MTEKEAREVSKILVEADTYCSRCAGSLCRMFIKEFPLWINVVKEEYKNKFDEELKL